MQFPISYPSPLLDSIISLAFHKSTQSPQLQSNKAFTVLRYLIYRLTKHGSSNPMNAHLTLAQTTIAKRLNISRQWIGILTKRLEAQGWIRHHSAKHKDGTNESTTWWIGPQLKRLIIGLTKSKQRKTPIQSCDNHARHLVPLSGVKPLFRVQERENEPPSEAQMQKMPIIRKWWNWGKQ